jgi:hypothetical protein
MKNIHLLPIDKPRTYKGGKVSTFTAVSSMIPTETIYNIYITSDEKPKAGDWSLYHNKIHKCIEDIVGDEFKKIILTTDQDLIADGVQAIDDEFLEWFVKNPSCEEVEVIYEPKNFLDTKQGWEYKIIIPKEEPKQRLEKYSERFDNDKSAIGNPDTWGRRVVEEPKQETLEEATERIYDDNLFDYQKYRNGFIKGAKWQQERSYSEEEVKDMLFEALNKKQEQCCITNTKDSIVREVLKQFKNK